MQREYYSCDATYRNWLKYELENADVSPSELSLEEKERAAAAAREAIWSTLSLVESESIYLSFFYFWFSVYLHSLYLVDLYSSCD